MSGTVTYGEITLLKNNILGYELEFGEQKLKSGLILKNDDMTETGIHPRWCRIYKVSKQIEKDYDIHAGQYVLLDHARWSTGFLLDEGDGPVMVRYLDYKEIFLVSDEKPYDYSTY